MRVKYPLISLGLTAWMLLLASGAWASTFAPVRDQQLVCEATDIVRGQIVDVQSAWDQDGVAIWTTATLQVQSGLRGGLLPGMLLELKEVGGTVNGFTVKAEGFPTFLRGQEAVMLLRPWDDGSATYRVWGYGRGMFHVIRQGAGEPATRRYDVDGSGRTTMFTDQIPAVSRLDALNRQLDALARRCK